jgi:hypothetical protein
MPSQINVLAKSFAPNVLNFFLESPETIAAKEKIEQEESGQLTFTLSLSKELQQAMTDMFGFTVQSVPLRWIKGDTKPHIDQGASPFSKTYLAYLTDSPGSFVVGKETFDIRQGTAFAFEEGILHETLHTGTNPRLLLGPMSEKGQPVGAVGTTISGPSGTSAYIKQESGTVSYSYDLVNWTTVFFWPIFVSNSDLTPTNTFNLQFTTDLLVVGPSEHLIISSSYVQIGDRALNLNGSTPTITVDGVADYPGLVQNAFSYSFVNVFNLTISAINASTLAPGSGWVAGGSFAQNSATSNYIVNCHSDGDISLNSGGIVGQNACNNGGTLYVIGCSSTGLLSGNLSGGIVGQLAGIGGGGVFVSNCWSEGAITGDGCGGIVGSSSVNVTVSSSYSMGLISGTNCGGILGANAGINASQASACYSTGDITGANSGGICGSQSPGPGDTFTINLENCYTTGNLNNTFPNSNGGISGILIPGTGTVAVSITTCYTTGTVVLPTGYFIGGETSISGTGTGYSIINSFSEAGNGGSSGSWNDSNAKSVLIGYAPSSPGVGSSWVSLSADSPFLLLKMGYTPYSLTNIASSDLERTQSFSVPKGQSSPAAIVSGLNYLILEKSGGVPSAYGTIAINSVTGSIATSSSTVAGTYTIYVYNTGSYNITTVTLMVTNPLPPPPVPVPASPFPPHFLPLFLGHKRAFQQKSRFCGTKAVSSDAVGLGAMRGIGSMKRILNTSK